MNDAPVMTLTFTLPYPPTVNTYWRHTIRGGRFRKTRAVTYLSEQGERYRRDAMISLREGKVPRGALKGRLSVWATAYPPDERKRDLDNLWKGALDALTHAGIIADDGDIDDLHIVRGPKRAGGCLLLRVSELTSST